MHGAQRFFRLQIKNYIVNVIGLGEWSNFNSGVPGRKCNPVEIGVVEIGSIFTTSTQNSKSYNSEAMKAMDMG
jgi:hypothetical protein